MKLEHTVNIQRPVAEVFDLVANPDNDVRWGGLIVASEQATPGRIGVGTLFKQTATFMGARTSFDLAITQLDPERSVCYEIARPVVISHCRIFEPVVDGTQLTFSLDVTLEGGYRLGGSVVARMGKRQLEEDLESVKKLLESSEG